MNCPHCYGDGYLEGDRTGDCGTYASTWECDPCQGKGKLDGPCQCEECMPEENETPAP